MKTQSAKAKGRNLQKFVRDRILEVFELEEGDVESRGMGGPGVDIIMSPKARRMCPLSIECKSTKATPSLSALKQSQANAYKDTLPVVAHKPFRANYDDTVVLIKLEDLLEWLKRRN